MENNVCRSKAMAISILSTLQEVLHGVQREALTSVLEFVKDRLDDIPSDPEEVEAQIREIKLSFKKGMSLEERKAEAAFYLEDVISLEKFKAMDELNQNEFLKNGGLVDQEETAGKTA